ncbi:protein ELC-like [Magnolia sinica]|uniref:protein ELC-like n=1 Tax=Magnolia sinica TaxID=86752 RepID=UPI00265A9045|nr:protein ELC-like [Magnolia sinica]
MAPLPAVRFIDAALSNSGPRALSYAEHGHKWKWIIREHLLNLLQDFPTLSLSIDMFTHDDGTTVHLFKASGPLPVSSNTPPIPLTIWIHQCYPITPPLVFLSSGPTNQIIHHHPFVDPSGATISSYLQTWSYPQSNLSDLIRNLSHILAYHPPYSTSFPSTNFPNFASLSLVSKREALDRLMGSIHYDLMAMHTQAEQDVNDLSGLQVMLAQRADITSTLIYDLEHERSSLKKRLAAMAEQTDLLQNWLRVHDPISTVVSAHDEMKEGFEGADEESRRTIESVAADSGIEDVMYVLDKAVEEGVVQFHDYLKQVRALAKEQFFHRAAIVNAWHKKAKGRCSRGHSSGGTHSKDALVRRSDQFRSSGGPHMYEENGQKGRPTT